MTQEVKSKGFFIGVLDTLGRSQGAPADLAMLADALILNCKRCSFQLECLQN